MLAIQTGIAITMRCPRFTISMHSFSNSSLAFVCYPLEALLVVYLMCTGCTKQSFIVLL
jgi:hypothetical protein